MKRIIAAVFAVASLALFSCETTSKASKSSVEAETQVKKDGSEMSGLVGDWKLSKVVMNGIERDIYPANIVITKDGGAYIFAGNSGVNQYTGSVTVDKNGNLTVTAPYASTKMAGPTEIMEFEDDFLRVLSFAGKVNLTEKLELLDIQSESKLIFVK